MRAKDLMSRTLVTCDLCSTVRDAVNQMNEHSIGSVLIVADERLRGIFTERDLLRRVIGKGQDLDHTLLETVMTPNPETTHEMEDAMIIMFKLFSSSYRHLPVVRDGKPIGMISVNSPHLRDLLVVVDNFLGPSYTTATIEKIIRKDRDEEFGKYIREQYGTKHYFDIQESGEMQAVKKKLAEEFEGVYQGLRQTSRALRFKTNPQRSSARPQEAVKALKKLLIIEDEINMQNVYKRLFRNQYDMDFAENGREGVRKAMYNHYDLIVSDLKMAVMNGADAIAAIHHIKPDQKFIVVSGYIETASYQACLRAVPTIVHTLQKPFIQEDLQAVIASSVA